MVNSAFKPDFYIFSYNEQLKKNFKKIHQQVFIVSYLLACFNILLKGQRALGKTQTFLLL